MTALLLPDETLTLGVNVIVRPGDEWHDSLVCGFAVVEPHKCTAVRPPQDWVALTGPCPTCKGTGNRNYDVDLDDMIVDDVSDEDCPDCHNGRRIVPLYTECPMEWIAGWKCDGWIRDKDGDPYCKCDRCEDGAVLVGRGSIAVVPVVAAYEDGTGPCIRVFPALGGCVAHHLPQLADGEWSLDPLPRPGIDFGIVIDCMEVVS